MLKSRSAILGELQQQNFVAVVCGKKSLAHFSYALTSTGQLCLFGRNRTLEKFTNTMVQVLVIVHNYNKHHLVPVL